MIYRVYETREALEDLSRMSGYMSVQLSNPKAASDFISRYDMEIKKLAWYPMAYRSTRLWYRTYEIRMKPFKSYHIFYIVKTEKREIIVLRVIKNRQDWQYLLKSQREYHW